MKRWKDLAVLLLLGGLLLGFGLWSALRTPEEISVSERRPLAQPPELSASALLSGKYAQQAEEAAPDQFPLRETFRRLKALVSRDLFGQKDVNGIYLAEGYASQLEYPQNDASLDHAAERIRWICEHMLQESRVFFSVIPDKNAFLAAENGYPALDYDAFIEDICARLPELSYIDLRQTLSLEDYYRTDLHWRQEALLETARALAEGLGVTLPQTDYTENTLDTPYYGIYAGQSALPMEPDALRWLTSETLEQCRVWNGETDTWGPVYDLEKGAGKDPYELFLSGSVSLLRLENPNAKTDRELIVFRDSFGSSLVPLLVNDYAKVTLVDLRYIRSDYLGQFLDFHGQDVLFLYSTLLLNNSSSIK